MMSIANRTAKLASEILTRSEFAQVQRELNLKGGGNRHLKPVELSSIDEAMKQEAIGSLAR